VTKITECVIILCDDLVTYQELDAEAVGLCTLALRNPKEAVRIFTHYNR